MSWLSGHRPSLEVIQLVVSIGFYCAGMFTAAIALLAIYANRRNQRENNARRAYFNYLRLAMDNPNFAFPPLSNIDLQAQTAQGTRETFERYEWFVSAVIATVKYILESSGSNSMWRRMMVLQLAYHWRYLERFRTERDYLVTWGSDLRQEIDEGISLGKTKF